MINKRTLRLGEFYSGPGGLSLGAFQAGKAFKKQGLNIEHAWASDYDEDSCKTYAKNLCGGDMSNVYCANIHNLNLKELKPIDIFAYGFPCNDFSIVGKQKGFDGKFGPLYSYGVKIINMHNPLFFVAENVGGITSANDGGAFKKILSDLKNAGKKYNLTAHLYRAEDYGVPQTRHRVVIVGMRKDLGVTFRVPEPTTKGNPVTAKEALAGISKNAYNNENARVSETVAERLRLIQPGENVWTAKLPKRLQLNVKSAKLSQIYKRLHPDKPSYTLTGSGGGGTHGYHWDEPRPLTNRERARIQTFPDDFVFEGGVGSVRKQIGMAVPVKLSEIIFTSALKTLSGMEYKNIKSNIQTQ